MNQKNKGNRGERAIVNLLNERFSHLTATRGTFGRTGSSGGHWSHQKGMSQATAEQYTGDLITPTGFRWSLEVKTGYEEPSLPNLLSGHSKQFSVWLAQASQDAKKINREPMLIWKPDRKPPVAAARIQNNAFNYLYFNGFYFYSLENILSLDDYYFFEN